MASLVPASLLLRRWWRCWGGVVVGGAKADGAHAVAPGRAAAGGTWWQAPAAGAGPKAARGRSGRACMRARALDGKAATKRRAMARQPGTACGSHAHQSPVTPGNGAAAGDRVRKPRSSVTGYAKPARARVRGRNGLDRAPPALIRDTLHPFHRHGGSLGSPRPLAGPGNPALIGFANSSSPCFIPVPRWPPQFV
ncbi:MAG: hypothetical protein J3K34DRAFT_283410 [Monoraphidium minutum]|nr:MAG: hypothetical protein J3K34DRAFT_283410 [Monoraphidium minutum]